jgi:hypothetical protein
MSYHGFSHRNDTVFLVGDAASFICVPTGEGIYQAMKSGELAAKKILGIKENYTRDFIMLMLYPTALGWGVPLTAGLSPIIRPMLEYFGPIGTSIAGFFCEKLEKRNYLKNILMNGIYPVVDQIMERESE